MGCFVGTGAFDGIHRFYLGIMAAVVMAGLIACFGMTALSSAGAAAGMPDFAGSADSVAPAAAVVVVAGIVGIAGTALAALARRTDCNHSEWTVCSSGRTNPHAAVAVVSGWI